MNISEQFVGNTHTIRPFVRMGPTKAYLKIRREFRFDFLLSTLRLHLSSQSEITFEAKTSVGYWYRGPTCPRPARIRIKALEVFCPDTDCTVAGPCSRGSKPHGTWQGSIPH